MLNWDILAERKSFCGEVSVKKARQKKESQWHAKLA